MAIRFSGQRYCLRINPCPRVMPWVVSARRTPPSVVVSGWQIYDNKGRVMEKFEPFFAQGFAYRSPEGDQFGQKVTMFYDPRGQVIRTVNPDGSEQRVIFGVPGTIITPYLPNPDVFEPTPWEAYTYDANDNAERTRGSGDPTHWNTPEHRDRWARAHDQNRRAQWPQPVCRLVHHTPHLRHPR